MMSRLIFACARLSFPLLAVLFLFHPQGTVSALSTQYSHAYQEELAESGQCKIQSYSGWFRLLNPNVTVSYNASVINVATGAVIACGASGYSGNTITI